MAAYTSTQAGNWSSTATWGGTGPPGSGDTATVNHAVTITADTTIGDGTNITVLTVGTTASSLTVTGATLTIRGNAATGAYNGGTVRDYVTLDPSGTTPAILEFDGNAGVSPVVTTDYDCRWVSNGTTSATNVVRTKPGSAGGHGSFANAAGVTRTGFWLASYTTFSALGNATTPGIATNSADGGAAFATNPTHFTLSFDHCTFDGCGTTPKASTGTDGSLIWSFADCAWTNSLASSSDGCMQAIATFALISPGVRSILRCTFAGDIPVQLPSQRDFTVADSYFGGGLQSGIESQSWASFSGNFCRQPVTQESLYAGDVTDSYFFADGGGGSFCLVSDYQDFTYSGNLFDPSAAGGPGYCIGFTEASNGPRPSSSVTGNVLVPAAADWQLLAATTTATAPNVLAAAVTKNTATLATVGAIAIRASGTGGERAGSILAVRDNLFWATGAPANTPVANHGQADDPSTGVVVDVVTAANCHHNAYSSAAVQPATYWTVTHPTTGATTCSDGTIYSTAMSGSTPPGANDVNLGTISDAQAQGPKFLDPARNFAAWCTHKGYADVAAGLAAIRANLALIADARDWVRAGFAPRQSLLATAASDGTTIGAVAYVAAASTSHNSCLLGVGA